MDGFLTHHMMIHIMVMNLLAPLVILLLPVGWRQGRLVQGRALALATAVQMGLLWGWHLPSALTAALHAPALMAAMHVSLFLAALWFWASIATAWRQRQWTPLAALLVSGKLFCLLGLMLVFATRPLYAEAGALHGLSPVAVLVDQQQAGLLMLIACPIVYVLCGTLMAWQSTVGWRRMA